jgi:hypothetical protein
MSDRMITELAEAKRQDYRKAAENYHMIKVATALPNQESVKSPQPRVGKLWNWLAKWKLHSHAGANSL